MTRSTFKTRSRGAPFPKAIIKGRIPIAERKAYGALRNIRDLPTRNLVRGLITAQCDTALAPSAISNLKRQANIDDLPAATELLLGKAGAFPYPRQKARSVDLIRAHGLSNNPVDVEVAFLCGRMNGWKTEALTILNTALALSNLPEADPDDAIQALTLFVEHWGASNFAIKKVAYLASKYRSISEVHLPLGRIFESIDHKRTPAPYFSAMEALDLEFPYFGGAKTRLQIHRGYVNTDFRQVYSLNNYCPSPIDVPDVGPFLRKAFTMSLPDEVIAAVQLFLLRDRWPGVFEQLQRYLDADILEKLAQFETVSFPAEALFRDVPKDEADLAYYRRSAAFMEFSAPAQYRRAVDDVIVPRLFSGNIEADDRRLLFRCTLRGLTRKPLGLLREQDYLTDQYVGRFLRTVQFLAHLQLHPETTFDQHQLREIFGNTRDLDILLSELELEKLYLLADDDSKPIVTILALALHKARGHDEDVDFKFRYSFSRAILDRFSGKVEKFIEWLIPGSPEIARYFLHVLDRPTLQKLYWIIPSADEADRVRQELLRLVGKHTDEIALFVEADSIEAERQVSKLRSYLDESRIYVDGVALKKWMIENPTSYAQQYLKLVEHHADAVTAKAVTLEDGKLVEVGRTKVTILSAFDYILAEATKEVFKEFCTNPNFGIESYLGRRIRHNTLAGMMRGGVDDLLEQQRFQPLLFDEDFEAAATAFLAYYRSKVEELRQDFLQFRSQTKPKGFFSSELDTTSEGYQQNLVALRKGAILLRTQEMFHELLIRFCWIEIDPQIRRAARYITVDLLNEVVKRQEEFLGRFSSPLQVDYRSQMRNAIHERFTRLGSWFRQPNSGFVNASPKQIGDLILVEASGTFADRPASLCWSGDAVDRLLGGLSVHRVYDCLFVLIRNALKYGADDSIYVSVGFEAEPQSGVARLKFSVASTLGEHHTRDNHLSRLRDSFADDDLSASMASEGYSGIRKLRFITQNSEGKSTAGYETEGDVCSVFFTLTVELGEEQDGADENPAD